MRMPTALRALQMIIRLDALVLLVLGVLFWTGNALALMPWHMLLGVVLVLLLWAMAGLAASRKAPIGMVAGAVVWGCDRVVAGTHADESAAGQHALDY